MCFVAIDLFHTISIHMVNAGLSASWLSSSCVYSELIFTIPFNRIISFNWLYKVIFNLSYEGMSSHCLPHEIESMLKSLIESIYLFSSMDLTHLSMICCHLSSWLLWLFAPGLPGCWNCLYMAWTKNCLVPGFPAWSHIVETPWVSKSLWHL